MRPLPLALILLPSLAFATPQDGSYRNDNGAVLFVEHAGAEGFDFTLSSAPTCPEGETQCMSVAGHAEATARGFTYVSPDDDRSRIFFAEGGGGLRILSTTGDLGTGTANHAVLLVLPGTYRADGSGAGADLPGAEETKGVPDELHAFRSPTGNIACLFAVGDTVEVRCDLRDLNRSFTTPPKDCDLDWGDSFAVASGDARGSLVCHGDTVMDPGAEVLDYGSRLFFGDVTCLSEKTGMTCQNGQGHGFTVARRVQRLF